MENKDYITVRRSAGAGTLGADGLPVIEDDYGTITVASFDEVTTFWGDVQEMKSDLIQQSGAMLQTRRLEITADSRDTEPVDLGDIVTINNLDNNEFVVINIFESDWRWKNTILVEFTNR